MLKVLLASIFAFLFTRGCERVILSDDDLFGGFVGMLGTNRFSRHDLSWLIFYYMVGECVERHEYDKNQSEKNITTTHRNIGFE